MCVLPMTALAGFLQLRLGSKSWDAKLTQPKQVPPASCPTGCTTSTASHLLNQPNRYGGDPIPNKRGGLLSSFAGRGRGEVKRAGREKKTL